jgi:alkanesulfonate monooxygenase SsuD/methylene tetrahydromethanopterin reductase-like flavin-dependent oxidoreductase (luciferase family)
MRVDLDVYGSAPMADPGAGLPDPRDRRVANEQVAQAYADLCHWARTADRLGYDTMWLTEHHFQHEGYELTPNLVLFGLHLAGITERLRFGQMFNVVPQWHPLRLAEDYAMADILSGGRMQFGVGRGTVPREAQSLGAVVASGDNQMSRDADALNREIFEESMEVILAAWRDERFSFHGRHFSFPPEGIPDRGGVVETLTLVPRPTSGMPEVFQPVTSPNTSTYVARQGFTGVFANAAPSIQQQRWDTFAEECASFGHELDPGERRCLQMIVHCAPTTEEALRVGGPSHDEYVKFLSPYGRFRFMAEGAPFDYRPTLEQTRADGVWAIGSYEEVADHIGGWVERLGLRHLVLFPELPGLGRERVDEQLHALAEEVLPRLGVSLLVR